MAEERGKLFMSRLLPGLPDSILTVVLSIGKVGFCTGGGWSIEVL